MFITSRAKFFVRFLLVLNQSDQDISSIVCKSSFNMQIPSTTFRQENLAMKKLEQNIKSIICFHQLWQTTKLLLPKQHIWQTSNQSAPSNFALKEKSPPS